MIATRTARQEDPRPPLTGRQALPSRNSQTLESPLIWLEEKKKEKAMDCPSNLWCIRGQLYDLSSFLTHHPGGAEWLRLAQGGDCTNLFETMHLNMPKVEPMLKKYHVRPCKNAITAMTFAPDGFYCSFRRRALQILGTERRVYRGTWHTEVISAGVITAYLLGLFYLGQNASPWLILPMAFLLNGCLGIGHNYFHQPPNLWRYAFDLSFYSSHSWMVSHAISHHNLVNTEQDYEVSALEPFLYFLANKPKNHPILVIFLFHVLLATASTLDFVRHWMAVLEGKEGVRWENFIVIAEFAFLYLMQSWNGVATLLAIQMLASWMQGSIGLIVHRSEMAWSEGDDGAVEDFGLHVMQTTLDHSLRWPMLPSLLCFSWLNRHIVHHFCPTIDVSRFEELEQALLDTCKEFHVQRETHEWWKLWISVFRRHDMTYFPDFLSGATKQKWNDKVKATQ